MSKVCRYILSKWRRFAKGSQQNAEVFRKEQMNTIGKASEASSQDQCQCLDKYQMQTFPYLFPRFAPLIAHCIKYLEKRFKLILTDWQIAREQTNAARKVSEASLQDSRHLFGMHQGRCCHKQILALLAQVLATLNYQRCIRSTM